jgi:glycosyltransferase involved in cell wall biosynthesis
MDSARKKLLIVSFTSLRNEPRPRKQILQLRDAFDITELAFMPSPEAADFAPVEVDRSAVRKTFSLAGMLAGDLGPYVRRYSTPARARLAATRFDLVIAHDITTCPMAFQFAGKAPVIIDLHEYLPLEKSQSLLWRLLFQRGVEQLCRRYLPRAAATMTVSEGIAELYRQNYGITPTVTYNAAFYQELSPTPVGDVIHLAHHGICTKERNIMELIAMMDQLQERFHLHLYLVGQGKYYEKAKARATAHPRIHWHDPVPLPDIPRTMNQYDIGLFLTPQNANFEFGLPNKFFEYIQARVAVLIWPTKAMSRILQQYGIGLTCPEATTASMAEALNSLTAERIAGFKRATHAAASALTAERSMEIIQSVVGRALATTR